MSRNPDRPRFDPILWDLDGTICETRRDITTGVNLVLGERGLQEMSVQEVSRNVGWGSRVLLTRCFEQRGVALSAAELDGHLLSFMHHYEDHLFDTTEIYPHLRVSLERLHGAGARMAVVSNKPETLSQKLIEGLGLGDHFAVVLGGDSLSARKPDPKPLIHAVESFGGRVDQTVMVGDSEIDIRAARAAGITIAAVGWGFTSIEQLTAASPDFLAEEPAALIDWLLC